MSRRISTDLFSFDDEMYYSFTVSQSDFQKIVPNTRRSWNKIMLCHGSKFLRDEFIYLSFYFFSLQCSDTVGLATAKVSGL